MEAKNKDLMVGVLAIIMVLSLIAAAGALMVVKIPQENKDLFNVALMAIVSGNGMILGWFYGSSRSSAKKDDTIAQITAPPSGPAPTSS